MPAIEPLKDLLKIIPKKMDPREQMLLEAGLLVFIHQILIDHQKMKNKNYFKLLKLSTDMENKMLEENLLSFIINDIISTGEYTLEGIAYYIDTHEDILFEIASGFNQNPSTIIFKKIISLHQSVRKDLYEAITKKFIISHFETWKDTIERK